MPIPRSFQLLVFSLLWTLSHAVDASAEGPPEKTTTLDGIGFTLSDGLQIASAARAPLVKWPVVADWDSEGRLVVVESGGVGRPIEEHNLKRLHRVIRLVDDDLDGQFDRRIVAADKLPFAEGVLCLGDSMLVSAPPHIWKLTDQDGDGVCEQREVWFDGQTITGCANDLHGPYLGRDGWIYWCKGAFAEQTHELINGKTLTDKSAHIYRRRREGGPIEPVMSGGMDNPVEVAITPEGERFFTSTFLQHPADGLRDGIAHAIYGGVYGKDHYVIDGLIRTGPLLPIMTHLGPAAPSGLACLESRNLLAPPSQNLVQRTLVAALFNLQKVTAHRLQPHGASFTTQDVDLLVADRIDFHPTDVIEDADGSLLVIDTGGWYDLCCPTSRVNQKIAPGGIYRLTSAATERSPNHRGSAVAWNQTTPADLVRLLDDSRPWVRRFAKLQLASRADDGAVELLGQVLHDQSAQLDRRLRALWALCTIGTNQTLACSAEALDADHPSLIQAACHVVSLHRFQPARAALKRLASSHPPQIMRVAAEALGRIDDGSAMDALLQDEHDRQPDRVLEHSRLYAMIEIGAAEPLAAFLTSKSSHQQRSAMLALNQLDGGDHLTAEQALRALQSESSELSRVACEILCQRPEWSEQAIRTIDALWKSQPSDHLAELLGSIAIAWKGQPATEALVRRWIVDRGAPTQDGRLITLLAGFSPAPLPATWVDPVNDWLRDSPAEVAQLLADFDLSAASCGPIVETMHQLLSGSDNLDTRARLAQALPPGERLPDDQLVSDLVESGQLRALSHVELSARQAERVLEQVPQLVARDLQPAIEAISSAQVDALDVRLLEMLAQLPTARTLPLNQLDNMYRNRGPELKTLAQQTSEQLQQPSADIDLQTETTLASLPAGDPLRGLQVFRSNKAACSACHQMGYVGGRIGPELTRIGKSRTRRALLEAILFPNSRLEQSYQPMKVLTKAGHVYNGLLKRHLDAGRFELQLSADKSVIVQTEDIELQEPSLVSIMPSGIREQLTDQELADLLALLESAK